MTRDEWLNTWTRIRKRWPEWLPNDVEADDWLHALSHFSPGLVEDACRYIAGQYSSRTPRLPWVLNECAAREERARVESASAVKEHEREVSMEEFKRDAEDTMQRLESADIEKLRAAVRYAVAEHPKWARMPKDGNVRSWPRALRAIVFCHLYPEDC